MSTPLATAIRSAADDVPAYDVLAGAIALGRRRRRRARLGAVAAALAMVAMLGVGTAALVGPHRPAPVGEPPTAPALPDRIGSPALFTADVSGSPSGPAGVIFREHGDIVTVGLTDDTYRTIGSGADPGRTALLSPDGGWVAYSADSQVAVADLRTGATRDYPAPVPGSDGVAPSAWLPDGTGLVVLSTTYAKDPTQEGIMKRLGVLDLSSGGYSEFASATWPINPAGFAVAVSPDGSRIAYQYNDFITVYQRDTAAKFVLRLDEHTALAGKGAWAPDGRSLAVIHRDLAAPVRQWDIRLLEPHTGVETDPDERVSITGPSVVRLLGWDGRTGNPIVVSYQASTDVNPGHGWTLLSDTVTQVSVEELSRSGPRTLVQPALGVTGIDVADVLITGGATRPGRPPGWITPSATVAVGLATLLACGLAGWWLRRHWMLCRPGTAGPVTRAGRTLSSG